MTIATVMGHRLCVESHQSPTLPVAKQADNGLVVITASISVLHSEGQGSIPCGSTNTHLVQWKVHSPAKAGI